MQHKTILSKDGYLLTKKLFSPTEINNIRNELTVEPMKFGVSYGKKKEDENLAFKVFRETEDYLIIPKYFGLQKFGKPDENKELKGEPINVTFKGSLREEQTKITDVVLPYMEKNDGGLICLGCGGGKCLGKDTEVLMYNGTIKLVQDIQVGDVLMGDDSTPRNVLTIARGREMMYKVNGSKGNGYIVNESHILSFKYGMTKGKIIKGNLIDMSVKDYLKLPPSYHGKASPLRGYRVPVTFPEKELEIDPYLFGYWLGDGHSYSTQISTQDATVIKYIVDCFKTKHKSLYLKYTSNYDYRINSLNNNNIFTDFLRKYNIFKNKHIPLHYKCNSRKNQLALLAGIIDSDGYNHNNCFEIVQKNEKLLDDIIYLARSLGFSAFKSKRNKTCTNAPGGPKTGVYYSTMIFGFGVEEVPVTCLRKKAHPRQQIKDNLNYLIKLEKLKEDDYYGFEIDGNRRFLLGDFTVTHNTVLSLFISGYFKVKTLIIVHKGFLLNQWKERIEQFTDAKVGIIQRDVMDVDGKDIVIGMIQSIAKEKYDPDIFRDFGLVIFDEAHHAPSKYFSRALPLIAAKKTLALSATPKRSDKLDKVLYWYFGPIMFKNELEENTTVLTKIYKYKIVHDKFVEKKMRGGMDVNRPGTITNIVTIGRRNKFIIDIVEEILLEEHRKVIVLSERKEHLELLKKRLDEREIATSGFYVGGMKQSKLDESANCQVIFGTFQMASEGLDIKGLNTLVMALPRREIEQTIGRITRDPNSPVRPLVIDITDDLESFVRQSYVRRKYYRTNGFQIKYYEVDENEIVFEEDITTTHVPEEKKSFGKIKAEDVDFID